uniref:Coluporin-5 n=1 Tax=Colubraria reticulata TaxID=604273 RepID=A0A499RJA6_9CAEN|nr:coluporin-5 [Colubraria reticulata]
MVLQFTALMTQLMIIPFAIEGYWRITPPPVKPLTPEALKLVYDTLHKGYSLKGTHAQGLETKGHRVTVAITVENLSYYTVRHPLVREEDGEVKDFEPSTAIYPGRNFTFAMWNKGGIHTTGTYGSMSLEVYEAERRVVLMWSAPYNFNMFRNWMGVGLTKKQNTGLENATAWFDQMYYHGNDTNLKFNRKEFKTDENPVTISDTEFLVLGVMGTSHTCRIKVIVVPLDMNKLSHTVRRDLGLAN